MIVECMLKEPRVSQLIQSSYLSYIETVKNHEKLN